MIRFADSESVSEIIQTDVLIDKFKNIKPIENISEKDSQQFWKDFFDSLEKLNDIDEKKFAEVYGRSEDEFTFDFDVNDSDVSMLIKVFCLEKWNTLAEAERIRKEQLGEYKRDLKRNNFAMRGSQYGFLFAINY